MKGDANMATQLDVRRHADLFDPYKFTTPVTIIGAGATGSWLALALAKLGITNIHVWDFDTVEEHNVPNQFYHIHDASKADMEQGVMAPQSKVHCLKQNVNLFTGTEIKINYEAFVDQRLSGIVFLMVDSMEARKSIFDASIKMKSAVKLLVEPRMGLSEGRIYNVNPMNLEHIRRYEDCWYSDADAEVSACGTSQTVITTAMSVASMCARQLINFHNNVELDNEILIDFMYNNIYPTRW
jgi:molybdopterin/thiamine biosynthesis adenylyltransferase